MNKKIIQVSIALFSVMLMISPSFANDCTWTPADIYDETFETNILNLMEQGPIESCAFSVLNGTEVFYSKGYGAQNGTDVAYYILSSGKMFTATAYLLLYEQGLIHLDDNINDYLPYKLKNPDYPTSIITIKHLLSHHSSIASDPAVMYWEGQLNGSVTYPSCIYDFWHENGSFYSPEYWYDWEPGAYHHYADIGFDILALAFENITETTLIDYIATNILDPLGMTNTKNDISEYAYEKLAVPYKWIPEIEVNEVQPYYNASLIPGAGGFYSTVEDMSKFMLTHLNQGEYNGIRILNETSIELMHTEVGGGYALGWLTNRVIEGRSYQGHTGGPAVGYCSRIGIVGSIGVVSLYNQGAVTDYQGKIFDHIFDLTLNLITEKTCKTNFYILPFFGTIAIIAIINLYKKRKEIKHE